MDTLSAEPADMQRHLAALLFADIAGSTPAMEADEDSAISRFKEFLDGVSDTIEKHGGRVFNTAGDAVLAEFPSAVGALRSTMEARSQLDDPNLMRFSLHLADVVRVDDDLRGNGVNLVARLQDAAGPGDIVISGDLYGHVKRNSPCQFEDLGRREFKGISDQVRVLRVTTSMDRHRYQLAPTRSSRVDGIKPNSVAVLPLKVASSTDEDQQFLADGLTEDLALELSRLRSLFVSSVTASASLTDTGPIEAGKKLGVHYVVTGSARKFGNRVRLNIALTNTEDGSVLWSERIERTFDEILDILDEITTRIAATVSGRIEQAVIAEVRLKRPGNMTAYEYYLRGLEHHRLCGVTPNHVDEAIAWFERAKNADPEYSRPYAMQVCSMSYKVDFDLNKAEVSLIKAMQLDPTDPEAHRIMGILQIKKNRNYHASRVHHEKALQLAPHDAYILGRCAAFYNFIGEQDKALDLIAEAERLDPFLPVWITEEWAATYYMQGRYAECLTAINNLPFQTRRTRIYAAAAYIETGQEELARAEIKRVLIDDPTVSVEYLRSQELYEDAARLNALIDNAVRAGLPLRPPAG